VVWETRKQGWSVALSADGNTAIVGGPGDDSVSHDGGIGAAWVFTRSGGVWTQQGNKLAGTDAVGMAEQGISVSLSGDGVRLSWAGHKTTRAGQHGSTPAPAASGPSKAANWSAPAARLEPAKVAPSHCPPTATPPS
jgi:hypothetical protein